MAQSFSFLTLPPKTTHRTKFPFAYLPHKSLILSSRKKPQHSPLGTPASPPSPMAAHQRNPAPAAYCSKAVNRSQFLVQRKFCPLRTQWDSWRTHHTPKTQPRLSPSTSEHSKLPRQMVNKTRQVFCSPDQGHSAHSILLHISDKPPLKILI